MESRQELLSYIQKHEIKLIRRKHRIGFCIGTTAAQLIEKLQKLPPNAIVDEVTNIDNDLLINNDITTIEFHEEKVDNAR